MIIDINNNIKNTYYIVNHLAALARFYIQLIKLPQTSLLTFTAFAGYTSAGGNLGILSLLTAAIGILFVISGTTALNMVFDRDIDQIMKRTKSRPIPLEKISSRSAAIFGNILIFAGFILSYMVSPLFSIIVMSGMFFDLVIYTIWLKRRSPWSIIFGGIAGGMPILAGRVLAAGEIDTIGLLMALSIVFWIPTHILTLAMNYSGDYRLAGVPTFPNIFGFVKARYFIAMSNLVAAGIIFIVFHLLNISANGLSIFWGGTLFLLIFSAMTVLNPGEKACFLLFKYASVYMVGIMLILILQ